MSLTLSDEILEATNLSEAELRRELALALFQQERLTLAQAAGLAEMPHLDFQRLLSSRRIPLHYGVEELEQDLARARRLARA
jgi:predicted HTH domain antitoxin